MVEQIEETRKGLYRLFVNAELIPGYDLHKFFQSAVTTCKSRRSSGLSIIFFIKAEFVALITTSTIHKNVCCVTQNTRKRNESIRLTSHLSLSWVHVWHRYQLPHCASSKFFSNQCLWNNAGFTRTHSIRRSAIKARGPRIHKRTQSTKIHFS